MSQVGFRSPKGGIWECCFGKVSCLECSLHQLLPSECHGPVAPSAICTLRTGPIAEPSTQTSQGARRIPSGRRADRSQITCLRSSEEQDNGIGGTCWECLQPHAGESCSGVLPASDRAWGCKAESTAMCKIAGAAAHSSSGGAAPVALGGDTATPTVLSHGSSGAVPQALP